MLVSPPRRGSAWMVNLTNYTSNNVRRFLCEDAKPTSCACGRWSLTYLYLRPASPRENHDVSWVASTPRSPVPAPLHLLALPLKPSLSGLRAPEHTLPFGFNPGDARDKSLIGRGVLLTTPAFVEPFCWSVGAQSTTQPWRSNPLTSLQMELRLQLSDVARRTKS